MAPETGLEPVTRRLTAGCSTIELLWNAQCVSNLSAQAVSVNGLVSDRLTGAQLVKTGIVQTVGLPDSGSHPPTPLPTSLVLPECESGTRSLGNLRCRSAPAVAPAILPKGNPDFGAHSRAARTARGGTVPGEGSNGQFSWWTGPFRVLGSEGTGAPGSTPLGQARGNHRQSGRSCTDGSTT